MAYRSLAFNTEIIWRAPLPSAERELANSIRDKISALRPHLLDFLRLNEEAPPHALTLAEWSQPATLSSFIATWSDHIYRHQPGQPREQKPLLSLWAQWYIGLLVPPLAGTSPAESAQSRMEKLVTTALQPVVQALEATGDINGKLIWNNTGYLINWYLGEMKTLLGDEKVAALRQRCFFEKQLSNGEDNPLWRTVVLREGQLVRRTCCQRYRLPDVQQCGDCTLK